jgi:DNA-binding response OmpR family regulator
MDKMKILLVDDDLTFLITYQKILERNGFIVIPARDGEEALNLALAEKPNIIILDVDIPKKDGLEVMKELRVSEWGKNVLIIILTGKEPDSVRLEQINRWNPAYYFVKGSQSTDTFVSKIQDLARK